MDFNKTSIQYENLTHKVAIPVWEVEVDDWYVILLLVSMCSLKSNKLDVWLRATHGFLVSLGPTAPAF